MSLEEKRGSLILHENDETDKFPFGLRVLAVDDDLVCLKVLENLLQKCHYQVTTTNESITALEMLRENRNMFDLVISDVHMPDMDGFKLLELVGLEMDLPVIMLSAHSDTKLVMKGITHGACDYLLKPVRIEELKNIWQHVVRRKKLDSWDQTKPVNEDQHHAEGTSSGQTDPNGKVNKKRKDHCEDDEEGEEDEDEDEDDDNEDGNEESSSNKKPRVVWSVDLHRKFVGAVNHLGLEKAVPKKILDMMNIDGLTRENVASHLQKYRLYLKRISHTASQQAMASAFGGKDPSYMRFGRPDGLGDYRTLGGPGRLPSSALTSFPQGGVLGRLNSSSGLGLHGISSPSLIQPGYNSMTSFGKLQDTILPTNQKPVFFQGTPTSLGHNNQFQLSKAPSTTHIESFNLPNSLTSFPLGRSNISLSNASNNLLMLQANTQQMQSKTAFGNQSSLSNIPLNTGSLDMSAHGSSNLPENNRLNERWQGPSVPLSKFASIMAMSAPFSHNHVPTNNLGDNISVTTSQIGHNSAPNFCSSVSASTSTPFMDSRGDMQIQTGFNGNSIQNLSCTTKAWDENIQIYNENLSNSFGNMDSLVSSNGGVLLDQNNAMVVNKGVNSNSLLEQLNDVSPYAEDEKSATDTKLSSSGNDDYLLNQPKSRDGFLHNNYESLDEIMSVMMKRDVNGTMMMDGDFVFDAYSLGSCP